MIPFFTGFLGTFRLRGGGPLARGLRRDFSGRPACGLRCHFATSKSHGVTVSPGHLSWESTRVVDLALNQSQTLETNI